VCAVRTCLLAFDGRELHSLSPGCHVSDLEFNGNVFTILSRHKRTKDTHQSKSEALTSPKQASPPQHQQNFQISERAEGREAQLSPPSKHNRVKYSQDLREQGTTSSHHPITSHDIMSLVGALRCACFRSARVADHRQTATSVIWMRNAGSGGHRQLQCNGARTIKQRTSQRGRDGRS